MLPPKLTVSLPGPVRSSPAWAPPDTALAADCSLPVEAGEPRNGPELVPVWEAMQQVVPARSALGDIGHQIAVHDRLAEIGRRPGAVGAPPCRPSRPVPGVTVLPLTFLIAEVWLGSVWVHGEPPVMAMLFQDWAVTVVVVVVMDMFPFGVAPGGGP
ncbi:hypothetical protein [Mangrovicoccus ximenensis]|uniref:hypothetical protein n=1 Tax=Mangrovicoccus ximenensis TaxID=1911570 RepID=UPI0011AE277B|nr:hypothetical protein [Mangrovicoccus ximenensis]